MNVLKQEQQKSQLPKEKRLVLKQIYLATNPLNESEKVPVYFANFVLMDYGFGAVFGCPGHDQRDLDFALKYKLPVKTVVKPIDEMIILKLKKKLILVRV